MVEKTFAIFAIKGPRGKETVNRIGRGVHRQGAGVLTMRAIPHGPVEVHFFKAIRAVEFIAKGGAIILMNVFPAIVTTVIFIRAVFAKELIVDIFTIFAQEFAFAFFAHGNAIEITIFAILIAVEFEGRATVHFIPAIMAGGIEVIIAVFA